MCGWGIGECVPGGDRGRGAEMCGFVGCGAIEAVGVVEMKVWFVVVCMWAEDSSRLHRSLALRLDVQTTSVPARLTTVPLLASLWMTSLSNSPVLTPRVMRFS